MNTEEIREEFEDLDVEDVAEKRLRMYKLFEKLIKLRIESENAVKGLKELEDSDGYMYKLSQDFLLSSSTMEKENKLEKMIGYVERKD